MPAALAGGPSPAPQARGGRARKRGGSGSGGAPAVSESVQEVSAMMGKVTISSGGDVQTAGDRWRPAHTLGMPITAHAPALPPQHSICDPLTCGEASGRPGCAGAEVGVARSRAIAPRAGEAGRAQRRWAKTSCRQQHPRCPQPWRERQSWGATKPQVQVRAASAESPAAAEGELPPTVAAVNAAALPAMRRRRPAMHVVACERARDVMCASLCTGVVAPTGPSTWTPPAAGRWRAVGQWSETSLQRMRPMFQIRPTPPRKARVARLGREVGGARRRGTNGAATVSGWCVWCAFCKEYCDVLVLMCLCICVSCASVYLGIYLCICLTFYLCI